MTIKDFITNSKTLDWQPLTEKGVNYNGVYVKPLRFDEKTKRSPSILLKFDKGATYPYHVHPAGEEILVLEGSCEIHTETLTQGDYLYTPPGGKHSVSSQTGCILFLSIPEEVILIQQDE